MATLATENLGDVGVEVRDVDVDRLLRDETLPLLCLELLEETGVLVFRGLHADDAAQVAFSRKLGPVESRPNRPVPEITVIALDPDRSPIAGYVAGTFEWHIDGTTDDVPNRATVLSAHALDGSGGQTEFASTYEAFGSLSPHEQDRMSRLRVMHSFVAAQIRQHPDPTPEELADWERMPKREHPLVWRHRSGRRSLVLGSTTSHVVGMAPDESRALLDGLLERSTSPSRVYRHEWEVGDMVIWDNCGVLHRVCPYDPASPREMHRTVLLGDEPIG